MNVFLAALVIWSLPFFGASCGSTSIQNSQRVEVQQPAPTPAQGEVTLTNEHPTGFFPLESNLLNNRPEILEVSVTKVRNPAASPVSIFVYLASDAKKGEAEPEKVLVGNFSLYPADRPGKFMLSPADAFRKLSETRKVSTAAEWRLVLEMQPPADSKPVPPVEVTIASPNWKGDKR